MFRDAGFSHILAVSGMHISAIIMLLGALMQIVPGKLRSAIIVIVLILYCGITGFSRVGDARVDNGRGYAHDAAGGSALRRAVRAGAGGDGNTRDYARRGAGYRLCTYVRRSHGDIRAVSRTALAPASYQNQARA